MRQTFRSRTGATTLMLVTLAGCGDSDGGDTSSSDGTGGPTTSSAGVNAPFADSLFLGEEGAGWVLDLSSGDFERIPGVRWEEGLDDGRDYRTAFSYQAEARPVGGEEFVLTVDGCEIDTQSRLSILDHCIALHDASGTELAVRAFESEVQVTARPSLSGSHVAVVSDDNLVTILDRELRTVSEARAAAPLLYGLSWLPDDRLLVAGSDSLFVTPPLQATTELLLGLDETDLSSLGGVAASADGARIAFSYGDDVYVLPLATGEPRLLPVVETFGFLGARMPAWSPDGKHLAIKVQGTGLLWSGPTGELTEGGGQNVFVENGVVIVPVTFGTSGTDGEPILDAHLVTSRTGVIRSGQSNAEAPLDERLSLDPEDAMWWVR